MTSVDGGPAEPEVRPGRSYLSIGEVLEALKDQFPDVTISKIRFFEGQGLLVPERTPSGYRKFYPPDVERLRVILAEQEERFVPLSTARTQVASTVATRSASPPDAFFVPDDEPDHGDVPTSDDDVADFDVDGDLGADRHPAGRGRARPRLDGSSETYRRPTVVPALRPVRPSLPEPAAFVPVLTHDSPPVAADMRSTRALADGTMTFSADELVASAGATDVLLADAIRQGFVRGRSVLGDVTFDEGDRRVLSSLVTYSAHGLDPRHVRVFLHAAQREADLYVQATLPLLRRRPRAGVSNDDPFHRFDALEAAGDELRSVVVHRALRSALEGTPGPSGAS